MTPIFAASSRAAEDAQLVRDLTAVIALHPQSCGQVVSADYLDDRYPSKSMPLAGR